MKVVLEDGREVDWIGPVTSTLIDGKISIDLTKFWARDGSGQILTLTDEETSKAKFPAWAEKAAEEAFDASLDGAVETWRRLAKTVYSNSGV